MEIDFIHKDNAVRLGGGLRAELRIQDCATKCNVRDKTKSGTNAIAQLRNGKHNRFIPVNLLDGDIFGLRIQKEFGFIALGAQNSLQGGFYCFEFGHRRRWFLKVFEASREFFEQGIKKP